MLGEAFYNIFKEQYEIKCSDIDLNSSWLEYLDFRDFEAYKKAVYNFKPDYIFHLGAHTSLEYCEQNSDDAYLTNTISAENATYLANSLDIPILYISTAGIFDGSQDTYDDWSIPNPLGVYARSKYMGELFVKENAYRYLICRAGWMMGGGHKKDKKFVNKLLTQLNNGKKELFVVDDKMGTPTYTVDFARNVELLISKEYWGLYNMVCKGVTSRFEVANSILDILNLKEKISLTAVSSNYFNKEYFAPRPLSERLLTKKLDYRNSNIMRPWEIALKDYLTNNFEDYKSNIFSSLNS
tara:strand:- start:4 stop:894 length:891 start_codon:yes stop_codon:yes gene_type:complete